MRYYTIRVTRTYDEEYADIEVKASSYRVAKNKAIRQAHKDESLLYGDRSDPDFSVLPIDDYE